VNVDWPERAKHSIRRLERCDKLSITRISISSLGAQISVGPPARSGSDSRPPWACRHRPHRRDGRGIPDFLANTTRANTVIAGADRDLPYAHQTIDLRSGRADGLGLPAPRNDLRLARPERAQAHEFIARKMEEMARASAPRISGNAGRATGAPGGHHEAAWRMGSIQKLVRQTKYGQSGHTQPVRVGSANFPAQSSFNRRSPIQALALHDGGCDREPLPKSPGPLI